MFGAIPEGEPQDRSQEDWSSRLEKREEPIPGPDLLSLEERRRFSPSREVPK